MGVSSEPGVLVLAGGGHTHALMLREWSEDPKTKPNDLIILISRKSTTLYSGMVPGLIAGIYEVEDVEINIRSLCNRANITFIQDEIIGIDVEKKHLLVKDRGTVSFTRLSINLGSISTPLRDEQLLQKNIKPLETAIAWLENKILAEKTSGHRSLLLERLTAVELC